jgi:WD40 repeat protein
VSPRRSTTVQEFRGYNTEDTGDDELEDDSTPSDKIVLELKLEHRLFCARHEDRGPTMRTYGGDASTRDPLTGEPKPVPITPMYYDLTFSPDGRRVAAARNDRTIALWDVDTGELSCELALEYTPYRIAFTPDSALLRTCSKAKTIEEWSIADARRLRLLKRKIIPGLCGAFSPDGLHAAVAGGSKKVAIFELENGQEVAPLGIPHGASVVNFSPSGRRVAASVLQAKGALTAWDFETRRRLYTIHPPGSGSADVVFSPDERLIACSNFFGGSITLWDADTGAFRSCPRQPGGSGRGIAFHRDGRSLISLGDHRLSVIDLASGTEKTCEPPHPEAGQLAASPDGRFVASAGDGDHVWLWKVQGA